MMSVHVVQLDATVKITVVNNSITAEVIVPFPKWDSIPRDKEAARANARLDANGVDYGFLTVTFGPDPECFSIESKPRFTKYEAFAGDVVLKLADPVARMAKWSKQGLLYGVLPSAVIDHPTQYPT